MRQERQEKVWSVQGSIKGRRRRRQEDKVNAGTGKGLRQGEWKGLLAARWGINTGRGMEWGRMTTQGNRPGPRHGGRGLEGSDPC